ncbi:hypothetical protein Hanom_Chr00s015063g01754061 [Helianthus anomalus]
MFRVSSTPFSFSLTTISVEVVEDFFAGSGFCFGTFLGVGLTNFFILCFSPFLASSSSSLSKTGAGVVPVNFTRASLIPLISACVSLYLASTITLTKSIYVLC